MNTIIFLPKEYRITLAIDRFYYIDIHIFDSKLHWWKMHSHVVEFFSVVFACFNVCSTLSIIVQRCLKSLKVKSDAFIFFKLSRFRKLNTHTVQQTLGIMKKKIIWVFKEKNLHKFILRWCSETNIGETWSFSLPGTWSKIPYTKKNCRWYFRQRSCFAFARSLFHKQHVYYQKSINMQLSFYLGHRTTLLISRRAQMSTEICMKLFTRRRINCEIDDVPSRLA